MSFGHDEIYNALNVSAITDELDTGPDLSSALWVSNVVPQDFAGNKSINVYTSGTYDPSLSYDEFTYTINCRAATYSESQAIAKAVVDNINRSHYTDYFILVFVLGTIPPADDQDNYNTPLTATIKKR
jgi:hypothetical protein